MAATHLVVHSADGPHAAHISVGIAPVQLILHKSTGTKTTRDTSEAQAPPDVTVSAAYVKPGVLALQLHATSSYLHDKAASS